MWYFCDIELQIALIFQSFEEELVFSFFESSDRHELSIDAYAYGDASFSRIVVDIRAPESEGSLRDEYEGRLTILEVELSRGAHLRVAGTFLSRLTSHAFRGYHRAYHETPLRFL